MACLQAKTDSVRAAIASSCTLATVTILNDLLLPKLDSQTATITTKSKKTAKTAGGKEVGLKAVKSKSKTKTVVLNEEKPEYGCEQLLPKERSILATEVINATLKSLSEAIKTPDPASIRRAASSKELVKASARKVLRRSNSLPQSPLQTRSLNRTSTSPIISSRASRSSSSASITTSGQRPTAECARIAFACLRSLQASKQIGVEFQPLQLENGMSVLIGKLVALGFDDLATKELRILKRRLDPEDIPKKGATKTVIPAQTLAEMLDFGNAPLTGAKLGLVITTQLQILRLMTTSRKPKNAEDSLLVLSTAHLSSPTRLLLLCAKESTSSKATEKTIRQLQTLSEILLSLCPSVSPSDDVIALESRLNIAPMMAIKLQTIALHNRLLWWGLASHKGDVSKDIWDPFLRCLTTFARRSKCEASETYKTAITAFDDLRTLLSDCSNSPQQATRSVLAGIYGLLGSLAKEAGCIDEAIQWVQQVQALLNPKLDSEARRSAIVAKLISLKLKSLSGDSTDEELLLTLLDSLERPFKGDTSEIDDLLTEVSHARRAAIQSLAQYRSASTSSKKLTDGMRQMCESLVFLCPRLCLRYLGNSPEARSTARDIIRYGQRKIFISSPAFHAIDSALFLVKILLTDGRSTWDLIDSKLQDCLLLLDRIDSNSESHEPTDGSPSYYIRISNLYYTQYINMQRDTDGKKESHLVRALRRSIDSIRTRPTIEKKTAQFSAKLERMAQLCKISGRHDELSRTLSDLRDEMIANGVLATVAEAARAQPLKVAWSQEEEAAVLGRTIHSLLRVCVKYLKATSQIELCNSSWSSDQKGAILEHELELLLNPQHDSAFATDLRRKVIHETLSVYGKEQYPIRRLRVLTRLISVDLGGLEDFAEILALELERSKIESLVVIGTEDQFLSSYLDHFKALALTTMELQQESPKLSILVQGVAVWSSIRLRSRDLAAFEREVDDVHDLVTHLHAIAGYQQMKGYDADRISILQLIADITELCDNPSAPDSLVLGFTNLSTQWIQLGYSGKARLALDRAKTYSHRNGVSSYASLRVHLASCEYMIAVGSFDKV